MRHVVACAACAILLWLLPAAAGGPAVRAAKAVRPLVRPLLVLYAPRMAADDLLSVRGQVSQTRGPARRVSVYVYEDASGRELASARVPLAPGGRFTTRLDLGGALLPSGLRRLYIGASYPGALAQGLVGDVTLLRMQGPFPAPVAQAAASVAQRTSMPVRVPTWLPQPLTARAPRLPYVSIRGANKSFTYTLDLRLTPRPYPYGAAAIEADGHPPLAYIQGVRFGSPAAAGRQLRHHLDQVRPTLPAHPARVRLGGGRTATAYAGRWHTLLWRQGAWTLVVRGPDRQQNVREAAAVVRDLAGHPLPAAGGVVWIRNIAVGDTAAAGTFEIDVSYRLGQNLYSVSGLYSPASQGDIARILRLAASLRVWRPAP